RMVLLDKDSPRDALMEIVRENMYTRYPVYQNDRDNIVGFIHCKDLFLHHRIELPEFALAEILRPPLYVPENKRASDLLREMQQKRMQMALVVDEYGDIIGLVTTEDLLEELVGEIEDEHDVGEPLRFERFPDGSLLVDGLISLNDLEEIIDVKFEEGLPYDTLAGVVLSELGRFPKKGERIGWHGFELICEEITPTSIVKVRLIVEES
ncbi:MAG: hemolysin family protein, partial [Desulfuromonadaceae bacterium]